MCVIAEMIEHMKSFVEKPNSVFGKFPVCPFAHKARKDDKIHWVVSEWNDVEISQMQKLMEDFSKSDRYDCVLFMNPNKEFTNDQTVAFNARLAAIGEPLGLVCFSGHPQDQFTAAGVRVRAEPCPNIQVIKKAFFDKAHAVLKKTHYFDRLSKEEKAAFDM